MGTDWGLLGTDSEPIGTSGNQSGPMGTDAGQWEPMGTGSEPIGTGFFGNPKW